MYYSCCTNHIVDFLPQGRHARRALHSGRVYRRGGQLAISAPAPAPAPAPAGDQAADRAQEGDRGKMP